VQGKLATNGNSILLSNLLHDLTTLNQSVARCAPHWDKLRAISNNPAARAAIIVPLVGYWIILNNWFVQNVLWLSQALVGPMPLHTPWQLFATFFGLWLVGAGSGVYLVFCPQDIKRYATSSEYTGAVGSTISSIEMGRILATLRNSDEKTKEELRRLDSEWPTPHHAEPAAEFDARLRQERWSNLLKLHFDASNRCYATARLLVTVLYIIGFTALALPSLNLFWRVATVAVETGFGVHQQSP